MGPYGPPGNANLVRIIEHLFKATTAVQMNDSMGEGLKSGLCKDALCHPSTITMRCNQT